MLKLFSREKPNFPYIYFIFLIILTVVAGGLGGYLWQVKGNASRSHELVLEINRLHADLVSQELSSNRVFADAQTQNNELKGSAQEMDAVSAVENEVKFNACKHITNFRYEQWYQDLKNESESYGTDLADSTSACFSRGAGLLIYLVPAGVPCQPADIYHFDINKNKLSKASFIQNTEQCFGVAEQFGKREGDIIKLKGFGEKDGCKWSDNFDYDFLKNTFELKERVGNCE